MGMAAGQARLLSITSRMSDNELRAQIINNNKMRLATQSSQVSEAYVTALNQAQMMFTNYDADNNTSYQELTFNAMTAYNPYNNQYGISNASGQILVSEKDATNFKNAGGSVDKFLESYGLEYSTSYFDNLNEYANADGTIPYLTGATDEEGKAITASSGLTAEALEKAYYGDGTAIHPGYYDTTTSQKYYDYQKAMEEYNTSYDAWVEATVENMKNKVTSIKVNDKDLNTLKKEVNSSSATVDTVIGVLNNLSLFINAVKPYSNMDKDSEAYFSNLEATINQAKSNEKTLDKTNSNIVFKDHSITIYNKTETDQNSMPIFTIERVVDENGAYTDQYKVYNYNDNNEKEEITDPAPTVTIENGKLTVTIPDGEKISGIPNLFVNGAGVDADGNYNNDFNMTIKSPYDLDTLKNQANSIIDSLNTTLYQHLNPAHTDFAPGKDTAVYQNYITASQNLEKIIFGTNTITDYQLYPNLTDLSWILENMNQTQIDNFQPIIDVIILDRIMNTYGEPKMSWIDKNNPNENGDKKAEWYTNLFTRMQQGYQVLQDGLASSSEWIQFAFENGLITMEQVDSNKNWNTISYTNCSDITEQTDSKAIAVAEAEYNAAMNKIENKDKRYDMELKNIDTEHNSLQTEYDSIKSAIDKNIERSFKIYS